MAETFTINNKKWTFKTGTFDEVQQEFMSGPNPPEERKVAGFTDYWTREVMVCDDMDPGKKLSTLRHELMHAYLDSVGIRLNEETTECDICDLYQSAVDTIEPIVQKLMSLSD